MKRLLILVSLMIFASCSSTIDTDVDYSSEKIDINSLKLTKSAVDFMHGDYSISLDDISTFLKFNAKGKKVVEISPISLSGDKVQGYLVSFDEGWELISADKRTNAVLAEGGRGHFSMDASKDQNEGRRVLLESFLDEVGTIQSIQSEQEAESVLGKDALQEMENNVMLWDLMTEPGKVLSCPETKVIDDWIYVLDDIQYDTVSLEVVNHLTETRWTQGEPYNQFFPYACINYPSRVPTGCVPLAGAQMLYFLHNEIGVPEYAPEHAEVSGTFDQFCWSQTGNSSTVWNAMNNGDGENEAILIADIANKAHVLFIEDMSGPKTGAWTSSLINPLHDYGIETYYCPYSKDSVNRYIFDKGLPVIADACYDSNDPYSGHCFIIDAGLKGEQRATFYYIKQYADGRQGIGFHQHVLNGIYIWKYGINWGFGTGYDYDWYLSSGSWTVDGMPFNHNRNLLLGYEISDN